MLHFALSLFFLGCLDISFCDERFENVALHKACDQSSSYDSFHPASYAVNGNTDGVYVQQPNCIHTATNDTSPWWQVNLGRPYPVYSITVWARGEGSTIVRMSNCTITVDGKVCYRFGQVALGSPREMKVSCTTPYVNGAVVMVTREPGPSGDEVAIQLCEFQVFSCSARYWGSGCAQDCGRCFGGVTCDKVTGECRCEPGWMPPLCTQECDPGTYGLNCTKQCGSCSDGPHSCHHVNGSCQACQDDFVMRLCKTLPVAGSGTQDVGRQVNVGMIAGLVVCGIVIIALLIVIVFLVRKRKSAVHEPERTRVVASEHVNVVYQNTGIATDHVNALYQETGILENAPVTTSGVEAPQPKTASVSVDAYERENPDLSNYDRLEVYENKKDITNLYTDLNPSQPGTL